MYACSTPAKLSNCYSYDNEVHSDFVFLDKPDIIPDMGWLVVRS